MSDNNEVVPFSEIETSGINLNAAVEQGQKMTALLKSMGIKEATFDSGAYFTHDNESQTSTLAADGIVMQQRAHTTTVTFRNAGSTPEQALEEVKNSGSTQKTLGAFSGTYQQRISQMLADEE
ncbi:hypothetical protein [Cellvibrio fontiphilus]|uniref:Uncharacterized protein n=1 Tax=Cellvibrio fontiphilus TaxID=1815559 RepID=A0ABV7FE53_9GAMM